MHADMVELPRIGITMGDAAGIGPEIVLKALADDDLRTSARCSVYGDLRHLKSLAESTGVDYQIGFRDDGQTNEVDVVDLANLPEAFEIGGDFAITGKASAEYILKAVEDWKLGKIDAICTAPISKKAISLGGFDFPGHTELLADLSNTEKFAMSFFGGRLRVVLLSTHLSLRNAIDLVKRESLIDLIQFTNRQLEKILNKKVKIAVAGLNPHASESGIFGNEEKTEIEPAIAYCQDELEIDVSGPYSPDTIFLRGYKGEFDAVVSLYHDQATIAVKSLCFGEAVNVTLGLPFIRTSVDHGTAFDIAGKGVADASSMRAAIRLGRDLVKNSQANTGNLIK